MNNKTKTKTKRNNNTNYFDTLGYLTTSTKGVNVTGGIDQNALNSKIIGAKDGTATGIGLPTSTPGISAAQGLGMATAAVGIGSDILGNLKTPTLVNKAITANNNDDLMSQWNSYQPIKAEHTDVFGAALKDGMSGASAGMSAGPLGAAIGAGVGLIGGGVSALFGNAAKDKQANQLQQQQVSNFDAKAGSINDKNIDNSLANYSAFGGNIFEGGGNFSNGVVTFNSGGTHEQNPDGGIPQGVGANGKPNLVEEGEVKYNDYIYSNRLKPDDNLLKEVGLPTKYAGKPFGEIADILSEESKERPNDPISKKGLDSNMDKLKQAQEILKLKKKQRERNAAEVAAIKSGQAVNADPQQGKLTDPNAPQSDPSQQGQQEQPDPNQPQGGQVPQQMARGGKLSGGANPQGIEPDMGQIMQQITGWLQQGMSPQQIVRQLVTAGISAQQAAHLVQQAATQSKNQSPSGAGTQQQQGLQVPDNSTQMAFGGNMFPDGGQPQQGGQQQMEQVIQAVTQMIQKGMSPQQIIQELVKMGIPQQAATELVQKVEQQAQGQGQQAQQGDPQQAQQQIAQQQGLQVPQQGQPMSFGGNLFARGGNIFSGEFGSSIDFGGIAQQQGAPFVQQQNPDLILNAMSPTGAKGTQYVAQQTGLGNYVAGHDAFMKTPSLNTYGQQNTSIPTNKGLTPDLLRYAPAIGSGLMAASDALGLSNKADYTGADAMAGLKVQGQKISNYLAYNPFDRDYYQNKLNANAGATRQSLANASNGNRATYAAGLLGADANYNNGLGDLAVKGEQYNQEQRQKVEEFNRGTNQFNAQQSNWEQGINTDLMAKSIAMRMQAKDSSAQARSANLNNFLNNTGNVGKEQASMNMINSNPALGYGINPNLDVYYKARKDAEDAAKAKANKKSNGGNLSKKGIEYGW